MSRVREFLFLATVLLVAAAASEPPKSADEIMARVAINQDAAQSARAAFVYRQNVVVRLRDTHGHLVREEISEYQVTPGSKQTHKELVKFSGRYQKGGSMVAYAESGKDKEDGFREEADSDIAHNMRDDLTGDRKSKDGVAPQLFPLTAKEQRKYHFTIKGEETYRGTEVYRIAFEPKQNTPLLDMDDDDPPWSGEALISKIDFQPVTITTKLAKKVPFLVRTALGTNLPGLGFSIQYEKFDNGVWFPVSYGTEFRVHVLFVYSRQVSISLVNSDFRRADVQTAVEFEKVQ
jgi:hypothetical protein